MKLDAHVQIQREVHGKTLRGRFSRFIAAKAELANHSQWMALHMSLNTARLSFCDTIVAKPATAAAVLHPCLLRQSHCIQIGIAGLEIHRYLTGPLQDRSTAIWIIMCLHLIYSSNSSWLILLGVLRRHGVAGEVSFHNDHLLIIISSQNAETHTQSAHLNIVSSLINSDV